MKGSAFGKLFQAKELKYIFGSNNINLFSLGLISFLALIAVGHAVGSYNVLEEKMNDPYTKWLKVPVPARNCDDANKLNDLFIKDGIANEMGIDTVLNYSINFIKAWNLEEMERFRVKYRTITPEESLLEHILNENNVVELFGSVDYKASGCWVILTEEMANTLGMSKGTNQVFFNPEDGLNIDIPVLAIVKYLPDVAEAIMCEHLHTRLYEIPWNETKFISQSNSNFSTLFRELDYMKFRSRVEKYNFYDDTDTTHLYINQEEWVHAEVWFSEGQEKALIDSLQNYSIYDIDKSIPVTSYNCNSSDWIDPDCHYYMSLMLSDLDKVRRIKTYTESKFPSLEISLNQVINKENFATVSFVTLLLTGLIIFLLSLATVLFLNSVLTSYLNKVARSIGSLKAFGLSDEVVKGSYLIVILKFVCSGFLIGIVLSILYNICFNNVSKNPEILSLMNPYVLLTLLILLGISIGVSLKKINSTLEKTPGDLIYNR